MDDALTTTAAGNASAAEMLRQGTALAPAIVRHAGAALLAWDADGRMMIFNGAAERLFGWPADEVIGRISAVWFYEPQRLATLAIELATELHREVAPQQALLLVSQSPRHCAAEWTMVRRDGTQFPATIAFSELQAARDGCNGMLAVVTDISERTQWEAAMLLAKDEALAAARAKSVFLTNMSHEIRTPLNAVIGMASLLLETRLDLEQRECTNTIRTASESLLQLINAILDFSQMDAGKLQLAVQPFCLAECVESAVELVAPRAIEKKIELHCWIDPSVPPTVTGDVARVRQILANLLINAVKYTHQGEVEITLRLQRPAEESTSTPTASPTGFLEFAVRDTGIGIPAERMNRLFQAFSQTDASNTRSYGGTGLGLAICRRLVELMNGRIWVESEPGIGSIFTFAIPCIAATAPVAEPPPSALPLAGRRLLVIAPPGNGRRAMSAHLARWGAETRIADSAVEALGLAHIRPGFDAAIIDSAMLEGSPLAQHAGALSMPVILLTPLGTQPQSASRISSAATLAKPLKARHLLAALKSTLPPTKVGPVPAAETAPGGRPATNATRRLLLVEDNAVNQRLAIMLLQRLGWTPELARNGLEALAALEREAFSFVLMDVQMPEMDGITATQEIRRRFPTVRQPTIVALTANALPGDREKCLAAGMNDYLSKPIRPDELRAMLEKWQPAAPRATQDGWPAVA